MTDAQLIAMVKFLVELQAQNLAMRKALHAGGAIGQAGLEGMIVEQRQALQKLPAISSVLQKNDLSMLSTLLDTLSVALPQ